MGLQFDSGFAFSFQPLAPFSQLIDGKPGWEIGMMRFGYSVMAGHDEKTKDPAKLQTWRIGFVQNVIAGASFFKYLIDKTFSLKTSWLLDVLDDPSDPDQSYRPFVAPPGRVRLQIASSSVLGTQAYVGVTRIPFYEIVWGPGGFEVSLEFQAWLQQKLQGGGQSSNPSLQGSSKGDIKSVPNTPLMLMHDDAPTTLLFDSLMLKGKDKPGTLVWVDQFVTLQFWLIKLLKGTPLPNVLPPSAVLAASPPFTIVNWFRSTGSPLRPEWGSYEFYGKRDDINKGLRNRAKWPAEELNKALEELQRVDVGKPIGLVPTTKKQPSYGPKVSGTSANAFSRKIFKDNGL